MGEIIKLNDGLYEYELPKMPTDERDIWYYDVKKKDQYWKTPHNKNFKWFDENGNIKNVKKMSERDKIEYIEYWRDKWYNGLWIFINGEPTWITGMHVDHLVFCTYNSRKLLYFDDERKCFYFRDKANNDDSCDGKTFIKPRRAKLTTEECTEAQYTLLQDFSQYITIQSDTLEKAQKSFMSPIIDSYVKRPFWMREEFYAPNGKKPRKSLELTSNIIKEESNELLGGRINIFPTVARATDGLEAALCIQDEFSKWTTASPYETFEVNRKVIHNFRKRGKIDCLSSTGDSDDYISSVMDWHKLVANSNPLYKDEHGFTMSGMWEYFIDATHSQYVPKEFTDIYGRVNKEKAEEWIWNEINKYPKGTKPYIFALYRLPLKKEHALMSSALSSNFNKIKISVRLNELRGLLPDEKPYVRGSLKEYSNGDVYFEADEEGKWFWAVQPYFSNERKIDTRNRYRKIGNVLFPPVNPEGAIGYDPIDYPKNLTSSTHLSRAAITVHKKFDYFNKEGDKDYCADVKMGLYLERPDDPHIANYELIKACKFTGYPVMHERSVSHVYEDFEAANMIPFLLKDSKDIYGISPSDMKAKKDGLSMLQTRYSNPKTESEIDQLMEHPFEDSLIDLDNFDIGNTNPFDAAMSEIYVEHGLKQIQFTNASDTSVNNMFKIINEIKPPRRRAS